MAPKNLDVKKFDEFLNAHLIELPKKVVEVQHFTKKEIENILGRSVLSQLLIKAHEYGLIKLSDNIINLFEQERELKILDVNKEKLVSTLENQAGAEKVFEGLIIDTYYDFNNGHIESLDGKVSFRIREKRDLEGHSTFYYTIKRKEPEDEDSEVMRVCYEKEFKINSIIIFTELLNYLGFYKARAKKKQRISYALGKIKFDIDDYSGIPTLLEIEAETKEIAEFYINALGLTDNKKSNNGSRGLFELYNVPYKTFPKPKVEKSTPSKPKIIKPELQKKD
ncbi:MAG: CYTH domain-containing protein [Candidatus Gracilibacteria bacterium]|nr:CYTH domain-containing protein [Candidatus Gracilibacteria bacterium]